MIEDKELLEEFIADAKAHTETIERGLLQVEQGNGEADLLHEIFRAAHSIKGTASFFGLEKIVELSHAMENLLGKMRKEKKFPSPQEIDALLGANDRLKYLLAGVLTGKDAAIDRELSALSADEPKVTQSDAALDKYRDMIAVMTKQGRKFYRLLWQASDRKRNAVNFCATLGKNIQSIGSLLAETAPVTEAGASGEACFVFSSVLEKDLVIMALGISAEELHQFHLPEEQDDLLFCLNQTAKKERVFTESPPVRQLVGEASSEFETSDSTRIFAEDRIKVDVTLLNQLVNLSSEMVLARNQLLRAIGPLNDEFAFLQPVLQKLDFTISEMQERIMRTRMQPIAMLLHSMPRLVRELSRKLGKQVQLSVQGEQVELDKSIIEGLVDPFTHLVRNALDHGIETPEIRAQKGKAPQGTLQIAAYHEGGRVFIDMKDDGAGISCEKVCKRALQQGLITVEQSEQLSQTEILKLIFLPGFSTVNTVSNISGRGVGLDVVRSNIEKLGGIVEVHSQEDKETVFRLILPFTLAIIPSLILGAGDFLFALPQVNLQEVVRISREKWEGLEQVGNCRLYQLRGALVPVIDLTTVIGSHSSEALIRPITKILILKSAVTVFGLQVDEMQDREEVLIKPLPHYLQRKRIYSGVTILGDGKIAMVLDVEGVAEVYRLARSAEQFPRSVKKIQTELRQASQQEILLFRSGPTGFLAVPLAAILRIEEILPQNMARVGGQDFYHAHGHIWRLLYPSEFLPSTSESEIPKRRYALILKNGPFPAAIVADKIEDTVAVMLEERLQSVEDLFSSLVVGGKLVFLLSLTAIFRDAQLKAPLAEHSVVQRENHPVTFGEQLGTKRILTFYLGSKLYGIELIYAREINRISEYTKISGEIESIAGLLNLRGQVITLFDVSRLLHEQTDATVRERHCIILKGDILENTGFFIDRLGDVITIDDACRESLPPQFGNKKETAVSQVVQTGATIILVLDIQQLLAESTPAIYGEERFV